MRTLSRLLLLFGLVGSQVAAAGPSHPAWVAGQLIVKPRAGLSDAQFEQILRSSKGRTIKHLKQINARVIAVAPQALDAVKRALSRNPHIDYVERNAFFGPSAITPNDPQFPNQWHLSTIGAPSAWETTTGSGIIVAVLDAGVDGTHPDLINNMVSGRNTSSDNSDTSAINVHGTAVAGAIAATGNNAKGVASVAWRAKIMPIRITNRTDGWANGADMVEGILWAADHGAGVVNISYELGPAGSPMNDAAQYLRNKGGLLVMSSGNSSNDDPRADNPYIIHVGATTPTDAWADFSNHGAFIDLSAPGENIITVWKDGGYGWGGGTSFACPVVVGVIALIKAANGELTANEVETILESSADDLGGNGWDKYFGHGRVNAAAAVQLATQSTPADTEPPTIQITSPANGQLVEGVVRVDMTASDNQGVASVELLVDGQKVGSDSTSPYSFSWNSAGQPAGAQIVLTARARDAAGNTSDASVTVTIAVVDSVPPIVTAPADVSAEATGTLTAVDLGVASAVDAEDGALVASPDNSGPFPVGTTLVTWSATDHAGNTGMATQTVTITEATEPPPPEPTNRPPAVTLTVSATSGKAPLDVAFHATGSDPDGHALTYDWAFGDGARAQDAGKSTSHIYTEKGRYSACVTATDTAGATATACVALRVTTNTGVGGSKGGGKKKDTRGTLALTQCDITWTFAAIDIDAPVDANGDWQPLTEAELLLAERQARGSMLACLEYEKTYELCSGLRDGGSDCWVFHVRSDGELDLLEGNASRFLLSSSDSGAPLARPLSLVGGCSAAGNSSASPPLLLLLLALVALIRRSDVRRGAARR